MSIYLTLICNICDISKFGIYYLLDFLKDIFNNLHVFYHTYMYYIFLLISHKQLLWQKYLNVNIELEIEGMKKIKCNVNYETK